MFTRNSFLLAAILVCAVYGAPSAEAQLRLAVDLRTNYVPVEQFAEVYTRVRSTTDPSVWDQSTLTALSTQDFLSGVRVADLEFAQTPDAEYLLNVDLLRTDGVLVARRTVILNLTGDHALTVIIQAPPAFSKGFLPATVGQDVPSTLEFTIDNTTGGLSVTELDFTDNMPAGVTLATPPAAATTCTGGTLTADAGDVIVSYTGGAVAAGASCTVSVNVTAASSGTYVNTSGELTSSLGSSGTASATLTVRPPPTVTKSFAPGTIAADGTSTVTVTIDNTLNAEDATGITFVDVLPTGMVVATPPNASTTCPGGNVTASAGAGSFAASDGTATGGTSCTVTVDVTAAVLGAYDNTVTVSSSLGTSDSAGDTLAVVEPPLVDKAFSPTEVALGQTATVSITIDNTANLVPATELAFTDSLPTGMTVADPVAASTTCTGGTLTAVPGASDFNYSGGSVAAGASCTVMVDVLATVAGPAQNQVIVGSSLAESPATAAAVLQVTITAIPTASTWGLLLLILVLTVAGLLRLRS